MGSRQHISIFPTLAQMELKEGMSVGTEGAKVHISSCPCADGIVDLRVSQSRSARPRTSTSQHFGVPDEQRPTWRSINSRGTAIEPAKRLRVTRVKNEVLIFAVWYC
jgi:hypothetical protein